MKTNFINGTLSSSYSDESVLNADYKSILDNTTIIPVPMKGLIIETSNTLLNQPEQKSITDYMDEDEKENFLKGCIKDPNEEEPNTNFLGGKHGFYPAEGLDDETINSINKTTCLWGVIPKDMESFVEKLNSRNYLTPDTVREFLTEIEYENIPLMYNAARDVAEKKIGKGKAVSSTFQIGEGKLKRELSDISILFSGKNIDTNNDGFYKTTFGVGAAYLTNFKELPANEATEILVNHFKSLGYTDIQFDSGLLETFFYSSIYTSKKLGEEILKKSGIDGLNPVAKIEFKTSDYGLSSVNITPYLEFDILSGKMALPKKVVINLTEMLSLNHNAQLDEGITMKNLWSKKCEELFAVVKDSTLKMKEADSVEVKYVRFAIENILDYIGANSNFAGKDDIIDEFVEDYATDCTARDLYIYAFQVIMEWEKTNKSGALKAKEKLTRILLSKTWSKYDTVRSK